MAMFNPAMFGGGAGGLLSQFFPEQGLRDIRPRADTPLFDITLGQSPEGLNVNLGRPGSLTGDTFDQRFVGMQPPAQQPQINAPQFQPPAQAAAAIDGANNAFQMGNQTFPMFGGPAMAQADPAALPPNAQPTAGRVPQGPLNPQQAEPVSQSELFSQKPASASDKWNDFLGRLNPEIGARNDAKKAQAETARGMYDVFVGQGFSPKEAAAKAVIAARNPKVLEEIMKPYANMESRIANTPNGPGGNATQQFADFLKTKSAAEKAGTVQGESQAQAQIDLPGALSSAKEQLRLIEELRNHPGRNQFGWHDVLGKAPLVPSTKGYDAENILNQVKSGAFMTAFQNLKGGGQITEVEGAKATAALARMDRATSKAEFEKALDDYTGVIKLGIDRASNKAGNEAPFGFKGNSDWKPLPNGMRIRQVQ